MRVVKFRAWAEKEKRMIHGDNLAFEEHMLLSESFKCGMLNFMQYIGFKDKHGVEIYEGDIVVIKCYSDDHVFVESEATRQITYSDELACFIAKDTTIDNFTTLTRLQQTCTVDYEVIGNIYENPELMD